MLKKLAPLLLTLALLSGCASSAPPGGEPSPTPPAGIPAETLQAVASYIAENTEGRIEKDKVFVTDRDGKVDISVRRGIANLEAFAETCELVVAAVETSLAEHGLELDRLSVTAQSGVDSGKLVSWNTRDLVSGTLADSTSGENIVKSGFAVEDVADYFAE